MQHSRDEVEILPASYSRGGRVQTVIPDALIESSGYSGIHRSVVVDLDVKCAAGGVWNVHACQFG